MPTRQGWTIAVSAVVAIVVGRVFGILELFVIGAALAVAVVLAVLVVQLFRPRLHVHRWVHPSMLTVGDAGRVDLTIENRGSVRSPRVSLVEPVGTASSARLTIATLGAGQHVDAGYRVPAQRRGVLTIGPTTLERYDLLGLAGGTTIATPATEVTVAPQTIEVAMPSLGHGVLGRHLLALAQRTGVGEFHSLRDYVPGDEPRSIHWRASARSEDLKVRQHEAQGVRRCIVILDREAASYPAPVDDAAADVFERAVTISASIALSAERAGLTTRFVTGGDIDLRGPDVATHALERLARLEPGPAIDDVERDPGEGLGLVVIVTSSPDRPAWRQTDRSTDPTLTRIGIFTGSGGDGGSRLTVD
ncbi:MAG: DUF58 domain-containing protein, partial [Ilumatobacter fluminis]